LAVFPGLIRLAVIEYGPGIKVNEKTAPKVSSFGAVSTFMSLFEKAFQTSLLLKTIQILV
jgi:hypothetical protein